MRLLEALANTDSLPKFAAGAFGEGGRRPGGAL